MRLQSASNAPPPREVLILEPDAEGHSQEWLQHLAEFVAANETAAAISVVAPPALCAALSRSMPVVAEGRIRFIALKPRELRLCTHRSLSIAAFARWWIMRRYLARTGANSGFFLSIDLLCLPLALGLRATGKPIAGVLFRPSVHYRSLGKYQPSSAERLRDLRKDLLYRLMLKNPSVRTVLSLDPFFPAHAESHYDHGIKVRALPEPPIMVPADDSTAPAIDFAPPGRVGLLLFGYLTERKGPLEVLDALRLLPTHISKRTALLLAGRVDPAIDCAIKERCSALARERPDLWLRIENRWLESRRTRSPGGTQRRRAGALPEICWIERRPHVGRPRRPASACSGIRPGRTSNSGPPAGRGGQFVRPCLFGARDRTNDRARTAKFHRRFIGRNVRLFLHAPALCFDAAFEPERTHRSVKPILDHTPKPRSCWKRRTSIVASVSFRARSVSRESIALSTIAQVWSREARGHAF